MKRFLLSILFLCTTVSLAIAVPARLMLQGQRKNATTNAIGNQVAFSKNLGQWCTTLDALGVYYDVVDPEEVPTLQALSGLWSYKKGPGGVPLTKQYDVVLHSIYWKGVDGGFLGCNRDSLTRYNIGQPQSARQAIQIFAGVPAINLGATDVWTQTATCSTGVQAFTLGFKSTAGYTQTAYVPGTKYRWRSGGVPTDYTQPVKLFTSGQPGILRTLVAQRTNVSGADATNQGRPLACDDCDSLLAGEGSPPDTAISWVRYRDADDKYPNIFGNPFNTSGEGVGFVDIGTMVGMVCLADSILGGRLIGQTPGWTPIKVAALLLGPTQRTTAGVGVLDGQGRGLDITDFERYKAVVRDSIIKNLGIKLTLGINPDSTEEYPEEVAFYNSLTNVKFLPVSFSGQWSPSFEGNASPDHLNDVFGRVRTRTRGYYGMTNCNPPQATPDTTTACLISYGFQKTNRVFGNRTCFAVFAPFGDYLGVSVGGKKIPNFGSIDGWNAALWWVGVRTVVIEVDVIDQNPNKTYATHGAFPYHTTPSDADMFETTPKRFGIYPDSSNRGTSPPVGYLTYAVTQLVTGDGGNVNLNTGHVYGSDFLNGLFFRLRLNSDQRFYYHNYRLQNTVFRIDASALAGSSSYLWPRRTGWWMTKQAVMPTLYMNYQANREIVKWVYVDEL